MIHIIVGTKAQLIKMASVMVEMQNRGIDYNFIFTSQHNETIKELMDNFNIKKPDYILDNAGKDVTGMLQLFFWTIKNLFRTLLHKKEIFKGEKGIVLVHGDAFSALLGTLMSKIAGLKVGHVESGLRSFYYFHPFPEEITRLLVFRLADYYFCPGEWALNNLKRYNGIKINTKTNTLYDTLQIAIKKLDKIQINVPKEKYAVVSIHRFENIYKKEQFEKIIKILEDISKKIKLLFILHLPTKKKLLEFEFYEQLKNNQNIELRPRYDYFKFVKLMKNCEFLISDGGSNQEESSYLGIPCLLLRYKTERKEGLGKNVVLSEFKNKTIKYFINNYKKFKTKRLQMRNSPTNIILQTIKRI